MEPLFSIVIPTFNSRKYVGECVRSAVNQTYENIEVVVDDNDSSDGTLDSLREEFDSRSNVLLFANDQDLNIPLGWNRAMKRAQGEYLLLLHSDNLLHPDYVKTMVALMRKTNARVAFSDAHYFDQSMPEGLFEGEIDLENYDRLVAGPTAVAYTFRSQRMIPTSATAIHRDCFEARPHYYPRYRWDPDMELLTSLALNFGVLHLHHPLCAIRTHEGQAPAWGDPIFSRQYFELLQLQHKRGRSEEFHFRRQWANSNEDITRRVGGLGVKPSVFVSYLWKWFKAESWQFQLALTQYLRKLKALASCAFRWHSTRRAKNKNMISNREVPAATKTAVAG